MSGGGRVAGDPDPGVQLLVVVCGAFERQLPPAVARPYSVVRPRVEGEGVARVASFDPDADEDGPSVGVHGVGGDVLVPEGRDLEAAP